jgi:hypothetical protein
VQTGFKVSLSHVLVALHACTTEKGITKQPRRDLTSRWCTALPSNMCLPALTAVHASRKGLRDPNSHKELPCTMSISLTPPSSCTCMCSEHREVTANTEACTTKLCQEHQNLEYKHTVKAYPCNECLLHRS